MLTFSSVIDAVCPRAGSTQRRNQILSRRKGPKTDFGAIIISLFSRWCAKENNSTVYFAQHFENTTPDAEGFYR